MLEPNSLNNNPNYVHIDVKWIYIPKNEKKNIYIYIIFSSKNKSL